MSKSIVTRAVGVALMIGLGACNAAQVTEAQSAQAKVQTAIQTACADVNGAAALAAPFSAVPQVGALLDYATGSCAGADAVAALVTKAVNDPTTVAWTEGLATTIKAAIPAKAAAAAASGRARITIADGSAPITVTQQD